MTQHGVPAGEVEDSPVNKGLWERLLDSGWIPLLGVPVGVLAILISQNTLTGAIIGGTLTLALTVILLWARNKQRRQRLTLVAARDRSFECLVRHPDASQDSLNHRWAYGISTLKAGTLTFQPLAGPDGLPIGRSSVFTDLANLGQREIPASQRRGANRSWQCIALSTDHGVIELLCPAEAGSVLAGVAP
ncbi:hypothetical protein [Citricoccus sp.]|uniref:hypothetical protein n=1 Tax=Citricoccus sp. TaxID=1978372 RepID=UPI0028BF1DAC|nr:hypothetical protein [Citricoccus sp.]